MLNPISMLVEPSGTEASPGTEGLGCPAPFDIAVHQLCIASIGSHHCRGVTSGPSAYSGYIESFMCRTFAKLLSKLGRSLSRACLVWEGIGCINRGSPHDLFA